MSSVTDQGIKQMQEAIRTPLLDDFFIGWNYVDSFYFVLLFVTVIWYMVDRRIGIRLFYLFALSGIVNHTLKAFFNLPRPCQVDPSVGILCFSSPGFPSGAAQTAMIVAMIACLEGKRRWIKVCGVVFALFLSFSRVYLGVHFPTQVLAGWVVGALLIGVYWWLFPLLERQWKRWVFLFPILLIFLTRGGQLHLVGLSLGVGMGLLLGEKSKHRKGIGVALFAGLGALGFALIPGEHFFSALAGGLWFSFLGEWVAMKWKG